MTTFARPAILPMDDVPELHNGDHMTREEFHRGVLTGAGDS